MSIFTRLTGRDRLVCRQVVELVTDYVEGTLTASERRRVDAHLRGCIGCQRFLDQMRTTIELSGHVTAAAVRALPSDTLESLVAAFRAARGGGT